jgi:hypothetical protein
MKNVSVLISLHISIFINKLSLFKDYNHYDKNRQQNKNIRVDLPVAKSIQSSEYKEQLLRHELLEKM